MPTSTLYYIPTPNKSNGAGSIVIFNTGRFFTRVDPFNKICVHFIKNAVCHSSLYFYLPLSTTGLNVVQISCTFTLSASLVRRSSRFRGSKASTLEVYFRCFFGGAPSPSPLCALRFAVFDAGVAFTTSSSAALNARGGVSTAAPLVCGEPCSDCSSVSDTA